MRQVGRGTAADHHAVVVDRRLVADHPSLHGVDVLVASDMKPNPSDLSDKPRKETTMNQEMKDALRKVLGGTDPESPARRQE